MKRKICYIKKNKPQSSVRIEKEKSCICRLKAKYANLTLRKSSRDINVQPLEAFVYLFVMHYEVGSGFYESSGSMGL